MSSAGLLEIVTPEWLLNRIGPTKRWSADSLSNLLDPALLEKLRLMWAAEELPGSQAWSPAAAGRAASSHGGTAPAAAAATAAGSEGGILDPAAGPSHDAVVKHRVLLSLLTLRPPVPDEVLQQARALVAVAAVDGSGSKAGRELVATTLAQLLRLNPSFLPDAATVQSIGLDPAAVGRALAAARDAYAAQVQGEARRVQAQVLASVRPPPTPAALAAAAAAREGESSSSTRGLPTLPPHPGQVHLGDLTIHARLHEPPALLWQHYAHAPPAGPLEAGSGKPLLPAGGHGHGVGGLHYSLTKAAHSAVAHRAGLLTRGVGAMNRLALLQSTGGDESAMAQEVEGVMSGLMALLRQGTEAGAGASARRLVGDASKMARSGLGLASSTVAAAGVGAAGLHRGKRQREAAQIVSEEELQRLQEAKRAGGGVGPTPVPTPVPTPTPTPTPAAAVSQSQVQGGQSQLAGSSAAVGPAQGGGSKGPAPTLEDVLADCPLLPEAARAVVQAFKEGRKFCSDAPLPGSAGAGSAAPLPSGIPPVPAPAHAPGVQLQHVYPVREQAAFIVHLLLQFDPRASEVEATAGVGGGGGGGGVSAFWKLYGRKKPQQAQAQGQQAAAPPPA